MVAEARAAADPVVVVQREPEEVLVAALHDANATLQAIKAQLWELSVSTGRADPAVLGVIGDWLDRVARIGKVVVDGDLSERLEKRLGWLAQDRAATAWTLLAAIVEASPLTAAQRLAVWESRFEGIRAVQDGRAPSRLSGDALHRYGDRLLEAAAVERAVADGVMPWDDDGSESEAEVPESSDCGDLVLFPAAGVGGRL